MPIMRFERGMPSPSSPYTQTYSTVSRTHPAATATAPTAPGVVYAQAEATSAVSAINAIRTDLLSVKQVLNGVIDDLQSAGLLG